MKPLELNVAACFPVDPTLRRQLVQAMGVIPAVVPNSVETTCARCGLVVWIGPRQAAYIAEHPEVVPWCVFCVASTPDDFLREAETLCLQNPDSRLTDE